MSYVRCHFPSSPTPMSKTVIFSVTVYFFISKLWFTLLHSHIHSYCLAVYKAYASYGLYDAIARRVRSRKNRKVINAIYSSSIL